MYSLVVVNGGLYMAIGRGDYFSNNINNNFNGIYFIASGPAQAALLNYGVRCETNLSNWPFLYCNNTNDFWIFGNFTRNQYTWASVQYNGTAASSYTSIFMSELNNQTPSYTTSYPNTSLPISEYSSTYYNKTVTPPSLVAINSSPYTLVSTAYNSANYLPFIILTPVIVWNPATTYYPAALTSKQLNAQAYQVDGVTPLSGSFVYSPPANTFVTLGINSLSTTFTPTSNSYAVTSANVSLNVTNPLYTNIFNQSDLISFLNSTYYLKGTLYNNITINPATWTFPTNSLGSGRVLEGAGKTITIQPLTTNVSWNGLLDLQGGVVQNMSIFVDNSQGGSLSLGASTSILSGTTSSGLVNCIYLYGTIPINNTNCGGLVGASSSCTIQTSQVGNNVSIVSVTGNFAGAISGNAYTGSMDNIVVYGTVSGNNAGIICGGNANGATINNARVNGTLSGINTGGFYGGSTGNCTVSNSYSLVTLNNSLAGTCVGTMASSSNLFVKNYFYLGTISNASAGTIGYFPSSSVMHLFNVATQNGGNYLTSGSTGFSNSINLQYFGNNTSFTGLSSGTIYAYAFDSTNSILYIGGNFTSIGGVSCNYICSWNGTSITSLSSGLNGIVYSLLFVGGVLYVGGDFTTAGGSTANDIATWNGSSWGTLGTGMNGVVYALNNIGSTIYAGGSFTTAGGTSANYLASWDGSSWSSVSSSSLNNTVYTISTSGLNIYVGGDFTTVGATTVNYIALYDGSNWSAIGSGANVGTSGRVNSIIYYGGSLYVGGNFTYAAGSSVTVNNIALWNGSNWSALPGGAAGTNGIVNSMSLNGTLLYLGGAFTTSSTLNTNYFSVWDITTSKWSSCSYYLNNSVQSVFYNSNIIYLGGTFTALCTTTGLTSNVISGLNGMAQINILNNITTYTSSYSNTLPPISNFDDYP